MRQQIYSIKDLKVGTYSSPFFATHDQVAIRNASDVVNDEKTTLNKWPSDFELWNLGIFDDSGKFIDNNPTIVCTLVSLLKTNNGNGNQKTFEEANGAKAAASNGIHPLSTPTEHTSQKSRA